MLARTMTMIILSYAAVSMLIIALAVISTPFATATAEFLQSETGIIFSAILCVLLGAAFLLAAPIVRYPLLFKIIGAISLAEAPLLLLAPLEFWAAYIDFWLISNLTSFRVIGAPAGIGMLVFIIVAAYPSLKSNSTEASENET